MTVLYNAVRYILNINAVVLLPFMIFGLGLIFRMKAGQALKAGLMVGIGFQGLKLVVSFMTTTLAPVVAYYQGAGEGFTIVDVGWQTLAAAAWATPFAALVVPLGFILNIILLKVKFTKTLNVGIWDYWHILTISAIAYVIFDSYILGIVIALLLSVITEKMGDIVAKPWQEYFGFEGTTGAIVFHSTTMLPIYWGVNWIIDKIPGIRKIDINIEKIAQKYGILGDPAVIGLLVGALMGIMTKQDIPTILSIAVGISAVMILTGRMVSVMMTGLTQFSNGAREWANKFLGEGEEIYLGMDYALGQGDNAAISAGILMIPITVFLGLILPGNKFFPITLLANLIVYTCVGAMATKGNIFRLVIGSTVLVIFLLYAQTFMAPLVTDMMVWAGIDIGGSMVTAGGSANFFAVLLGIVGKLMGKW